jgi:hypothetical protein
MKSFREYLAESVRTYPFVIKVAGELPEGFADSLESHLGKFGIAKMSNPKKSPITKKPLDFPTLENLETHTVELELQYPTTTQVLQEYLAHACSVPASHIKVLTPMQELEGEDTTEEEYQALLTTEEMGGSLDNEKQAQDTVGQKRMFQLLDELTKERDSDEMRPQNAVKDAGGDVMDNQDKPSKSAIGS